MRIAIYKEHGTGRNTKEKAIFFGLLLILGAAAGAVTVCLFDDVTPLMRLRFTQNIFKSQRDIEFTKQFGRSFMPPMFLLCIEFFSGFFAFGQVPEIITVMLRGFAGGVSAALVYLSEGAVGFFTVILWIIPLTLIGGAILSLGAFEGMRLSRRIAEYIFRGTEKSSCADLRFYSLKFALLTIFSALLSLADTAFTYLIWGT